MRSFTNQPRADSDSASPNADAPLPTYDASTRTGDERTGDSGNFGSEQPPSYGEATNGSAGRSGQHSLSQPARSTTYSAGGVNGIRTTTYHDGRNRTTRTVSWTNNHVIQVGGGSSGAGPGSSAAASRGTVNSVSDSGNMCIQGNTISGCITFTSSSVEVRRTDGSRWHSGT